MWVNEGEGEEEGEGEVVVVLVGWPFVASRPVRRMAHTQFFPTPLEKGVERERR